MSHSKIAGKALISIYGFFLVTYGLWTKYLSIPEILY